ncbi:hypothetical protein LX36DRAFT_324894 [Colletotrichum falcatum]|nr:hypothetical protein LX36DRAFT_324894 [Colletotrichum falcatum]
MGQGPTADGRRASVPLVCQHLIGGLCLVLSCPNWASYGGRNSGEKPHIEVSETLHLTPRPASLGDGRRPSPQTPRDPPRLGDPELAQMCSPSLRGPQKEAVRQSIVFVGVQAPASVSPLHHVMGFLLSSIGRQVADRRDVFQLSSGPSRPVPPHVKAHSPRPSQESDSGSGNRCVDPMISSTDAADATLFSGVSYKAATKRGLLFCRFDSITNTATGDCSLRSQCLLICQ